MILDTEERKFLVVALYLFRELLDGRMLERGKEGNQGGAGADE